MMQIAQNFAIINITTTSIITTPTWHPIVNSNTGCENEVPMEWWPISTVHGHTVERAGAGQDVKQWSYDITSWVDIHGK